MNKIKNYNTDQLKELYKQTLGKAPRGRNANSKEWLLSKIIDNDNLGKTKQTSNKTKKTSDKKKPETAESFLMENTDYPIAVPLMLKHNKSLAYWKRILKKYGDLGGTMTINGTKLGLRGNKWGGIPPQWWSNDKARLKYLKENNKSSKKKTSGKTKQISDKTKPTSGKDDIDELKKLYKQTLGKIPRGKNANSKEWLLSKIDSKNENPKPLQRQRTLELPYLPKDNSPNNPIHESPVDKCIKITKENSTASKYKKYSQRNSPPYPANKCCGKILPGKDGDYISDSVWSGGKDCRWRKIKTSSVPKAKTPKAKTPKAKSPRKAKFFDIAKDICPSFEYYDNCYDEEHDFLRANRGEIPRRPLKDVVKKKGILSGDIIFMGSSYESRQEYGITFYQSGVEYNNMIDGELFYWAESIESIKDYAKELFPNVNYDKAIKDLVKWAKDFGLNSEWIPIEPSTVTSQYIANMKFIHGSNWQPPKTTPAPKKASPIVKKKKKVSVKSQEPITATGNLTGNCIEITKDNSSASIYKKYSERKSPPYPANECCNMILPGKDGDYISNPEGPKNICRWRMYKKYL